MGKELLKKTPVSEKQDNVFCLLCKAQILQVKVHGSKVQSIKNTPHKKTKMSMTSAVILRGLRKLAAYHCQVQIYTTYNKVIDKLKFGFIEELFYGNPGKNIKGACEQVSDRDHTFSHHYHKHKGEDGMELAFKPSCCGVDRTANYVAGFHFTASHITLMQQVSAFLADPFG